MLFKQARKTGVAILGAARATLDNDPKFQGSLKKASIESGEELAKMSLGSELLVLIVRNIPKSQWFKYIGRGQYPKFKVKCLIRSNNETNNYACPFMLFWAKIVAVVIGIGGFLWLLRPLFSRGGSKPTGGFTITPS